MPPGRVHLFRQNFILSFIQWLVQEVFCQACDSRMGYLLRILPERTMGVRVEADVGASRPILQLLQALHCTAAEVRPAAHLPTHPPAACSVFMEPAP